MKNKRYIRTLCITMFLAVGFLYKTTIIQGSVYLYKKGSELVSRAANTLARKGARFFVGKHEERAEVATVRNGNQLSPDELEYRKNRTPVIKAALEKLLGSPLADNQVPTIALVGSGGGYRAMLGMIGSLVGIEKLGLLDGSMYVLGLSGSSWATGSWTASGLPIEEFQEQLIKTVDKGLEKISVSELKLMTTALAKQYSVDRTLGLADLFSVLLANRLLAEYGDARQNIQFSDFADQIKTGQTILPINVAVDGRNDSLTNAPWFEFSPFETGSAEFQAYIPTWALGRTFDKGVSTNLIVGLPLGYLMAIWGSAFAAHAALVWENLPIPIAAFKEKVHQALLSTPSIGGKRIAAATVENYMYGMTNQIAGTDKFLRLVDGGIGLTNLAYVPVSGKRPRNVDIIFLFDWSSAITGSPALKGAQEYAKRNNLKFPPINFTRVDETAITVFRDPHDTTVPVVVYIPRINNQEMWKDDYLGTEYPQYKDLANFNIAQCMNMREECNTLSFTYKKHARLVTQLAQANVVINKEAILDTIRSVVDAKGGRK